jgi:hypothetical protein
VTTARSLPGFRKWIIVSILLHVALVLAPSQFLEVFYPTEKYTVDEGSQGVDLDFTADYEVVEVNLQSEEATEVEIDVPLLVEIEQDQVSDRVTRPPLHYGGEPSDESSGGGVETGLGLIPTEPQFFPPVPRYIVPPDLEDLGIESIRLDLRILVSTVGEPLEIVLPDTLTDEEVRRRVLSSASRFRFQPAMKGDRPVSSWIDLPLVLESTKSD